MKLNASLDFLDVANIVGTERDIRKVLQKFLAKDIKPDINKSTITMEHDEDNPYLLTTLYYDLYKPSFPKANTKRSIALFKAMEKVDVVDPFVVNICFEFDVIKTYRLYRRY